MCSASSQGLVMKLNRAFDKIGASGEFQKLCNESANDNSFFYLLGGCVEKLEEPIVVNGKLDLLTIPDQITAEEFARQFEVDVAQLLGVSAADVEVTKRQVGPNAMEDGVEYASQTVEYVITASTVKDGDSLRKALEQELPTAQLAGGQPKNIDKVTLSETFAPTTLPGVELDTVDVTLAGIVSIFDFKKLDAVKQDVSKATGVSTYDIHVEAKALTNTATVVSIKMPKSSAVALRGQIQGGQLSQLGGAATQGAVVVAAPTPLPSPSPTARSVVRVTASPTTQNPTRNPTSPSPTNLPTRPPTGSPSIAQPPIAPVGSLTAPPSFVPTIEAGPLQDATSPPAPQAAAAMVNPNVQALLLTMGTYICYVLL